MRYLILAALAFLLLPSFGVLAAVAIAYALERHRDRKWVRELPAWRAEQ